MLSENESFLESVNARNLDLDLSSWEDDVRFLKDLKQKLEAL
ncbi:MULTISPECIES: hypothetical protein [Nitratireductor]|nr:MULTISPECIES: hypothetical protein [Nitratireductor]